VRFREACVKRRKPISPGNSSGQNPAELRCDSFCNWWECRICSRRCGAAFARLVSLKFRHYGPTLALVVSPVSSAGLPRLGPTVQTRCQHQVRSPGGARLPAKQHPLMQVPAYLLACGAFSPHATSNPLGNGGECWTRVVRERVAQ